MGYKGRDVEVVPLDKNRCLVTACDSLGAIGSKELDEVQVSNYIVGRFTTRVALLEVLSTGARIQVLTAAICNEPHPTGNEIMQGVQDELKANGIKSLPVAISTEKNISTKQTGLGITVVGICENSKLRIALSRPNDVIYCLGIPKVGEEVKSWDDPQLAQGKHIRKLLETPGVHDIIMIGSQGIRQEAELLAFNIEAEFILESSLAVNIDKSAGPATCLIFTFSPEENNLLPDFGEIPLTKIGFLK